MRIGEAAKASGVSARTLRYYEEEGLIAPERGANGYRDYCLAAIERVRLIRSLAQSGLPMRLIKEVLPYITPKTSPHGICPQFLAEVQEYRDRLAERIAGLATQQAALDAFLSAARADR